jgi:hypothetical protein
VFVVWGIRHTMHMHRGLAVAFPALLYFPTLSHKQLDFREKDIENMFWNWEKPYRCTNLINLAFICPNSTISPTNIEKINVCSDFLCNFVWNIYYSKKKWARYYQKCISVFMSSTRYSCPILMKLEFSQNILEKYSNDKCHENPTSETRIIPCGKTDKRTDRRTDLTKLTVAFRIFAEAPKRPQLQP